jgi:leucyl/phenylalanyl-tRNA---protein transferase
VDPAAILSLYARGFFPMDDAGPPAPDELPWWSADPRTVFELDETALAVTRRRARRSLAAAAPGWTLRADRAFDEVIEACGRPRTPGDGVWLTPRMHELYRTLAAAGHCHTFELWDEGAPGPPVLAAGLVAVLLGRAAMLESMFHRVPHAGNVLLVRTLEALAGGGCTLCDVQLSTPHTLRMGAREIPRGEYEARLRAALAGASGV